MKSISQILLESYSTINDDIVSYWNSTSKNKRIELLKAAGVDDTLYSNKNFYDLSHDVAEKLNKIFDLHLNENNSEIQYYVVGYDDDYKGNKIPNPLLISKGYMQTGLDRAKKWKNLNTAKKIRDEHQNATEINPMDWKEYKNKHKYKIWIVYKDNSMKELNENYLKDRRRQFITILLTKLNQIQSEKKLKDEINKVQNLVPGGPLKDKEINFIVDKWKTKNKERF